MQGNAANYCCHSQHSQEPSNLTVYKNKSGRQTYSINTVDKALENFTNTSLFKKFSFFVGM
jgi:hypothetical protein